MDMKPAGEWNNNAPDQLSRLLAAYRDAVAVPDPSPNFMPSLWSRIEAQRSFIQRLRWQASAFAAGAAMALLILGFLTVQPFSSRTGLDTTYVENLASQQEEAPEYAEVIFRHADYEAFER